MTTGAPSHPVTFMGQLRDTFQESRKAAKVMRFLPGSVSFSRGRAGGEAQGPAE